MNHFIEGKRIYLKAFTRSDIEIWYDWFNDAKITEHMNKGIFPNYIENQEQFFHSMRQDKNNLQLAIVKKEKDILAGSVGIHNISWVHRNADMSIVVGNKDCWGEGIGTEAIRLIVDHAFMKMNLQRLTAGTSVSNSGTRKCFEKNGFKLEGTRRKHLFYNNEYNDVLMYGLLKAEWDIR